MQKAQKLFRLDLKRLSCNYFEDMNFRLTVSQVWWVSNQKTGDTQNNLISSIEITHTRKLYGPKVNSREQMNFLS